MTGAVLAHAQVLMTMTVQQHVITGFAKQVKHILHVLKTAVILTALLLMILCVIQAVLE